VRNDELDDNRRKKDEKLGNGERSCFQTRDSSVPKLRTPDNKKEKKRKKKKGGKKPNDRAQEPRQGVA
jgi:hypothetical protein